MKISTRVLRYYEGEMNNTEREAFEADLKNSKSLQRELRLYKELLASLAKTKELEVDENYFNNTISRFRIKQSTNKRKYFPRYAFALAVTVIFVAILFYFNKNDEGKDARNLAEFTSDEIDSLAVYYPEFMAGLDTALINNDETYSSIIDEILTDELGLSEAAIDSIYSEHSYSSYDNYNFNNISDEEAQIVYNELIGRRLF